MLLGPTLFWEIKARGHSVFLDLKPHDIPNTVKSAMAVLRSRGDMVNLHAAEPQYDERGTDRTYKT